MIAWEALCVCDGVIVALGDSVPDDEEEPDIDWELVKDSEGVLVELGVCACEAVTVGVDVGDVVPDVLNDAVSDGDELCDSVSVCEDVKVGDTEGEAEFVRVSDCVDDSEGVADAVIEGEGDALREPLCDRVAVEEYEGVPDSDELCVLDSVRAPLGLPLELVVLDILIDCVKDNVCVCDGVCVPDAVSTLEALCVCVLDGDRVND